jgi:hypothetical protein
MPTHRKNRISRGRNHASSESIFCIESVRSEACAPGIIHPKRSACPVPVSPIFAIVENRSPNHANISHTEPKNQAIDCPTHDTNSVIDTDQSPSASHSVSSTHDQSPPGITGGVYHISVTPSVSTYMIDHELYI